MVSDCSSSSKNFCCRIKNCTLGKLIRDIKGTWGNKHSAVCHCPLRILDLNFCIVLDSSETPDSDSKALAALLVYILVYRLPVFFSYTAGYL
jgi:hypothetical protein